MLGNSSRDGEIERHVDDEVVREGGDGMDWFGIGSTMMRCEDESAGDWNWCERSFSLYTLFK